MKSNVVRTATVIIFVCFGVVGLHLLFGESKTPTLDGAINQVTVIALGFGAALFIVAALIGLLRQTRGIPAVGRLRRMAQLAYSAVLGVLPSRRKLAAPAGSCLAFSGALLVGLAATVVIVRQQIPDGGFASDGAGFGDYMRVRFFFGIGWVLSFSTALIIGAVVGVKIAKRQEGELPDQLEKPLM